MIGVGVAQSVRGAVLRSPGRKSSSTANSRSQGVIATKTVERHRTRWLGLADRLIVLTGTPDSSLSGGANFGGWRY